MSETAHERLAELFDRQLRAAEALQATLESEATALADQQTDTLKQLADSKDRLVSALEQLGAEVAQLLTQSGRSNDRNGLEGFIAAEGAALRPQWETLRDCLNRCRELNELNGRLLQQGHSELRQTLGVLQPGGVTGSTYAASGRTESGRGRRGPLGKA